MIFKYFSRKSDSMKVHFIAIGGSVMHQLAIALHNKGYQVSGSDDEIFEPSMSNLAAHGLLPAEPGWFPGKVSPDLDAIILGMHAKSDNPELIQARHLNLPIYSFPEYIFEESRTKKRVVVGGSHGKTTTTAMIMHVLKDAALEFDYLVGAKLPGFETSVRVTDAPVIVCEGDEYPASAIERRPKFHFLFPHIAVITGIAWDHINVFPTFEFYLEQFSIFIGMIEPGGLLIYNETDPELVQLIDSRKRTDIRYQPYGVPTHGIQGGKTTITIEGQESGLKVFGSHNLLNLHAAFFVCHELGVSAQQFVQSIASFSGASRRLEVLAEKGETIVFRDFAHAPSKLKATIDAVHKQFPHRKLIAVFELHTFSSLNEKFMEQYHGSMENADDAVVFFSKHALQLKRLPELSKEVVSKGFGNKNITIINDKTELENWLRSRSFSGTTLLLMSSGNYDGLDVGQLAKDIIDHQ